MPGTMQRQGSAEQAAIRGVARLNADQLRVQRRITLLLTVLPPAGVIAAIWSLWGRGFSWTDFGIMLGFYLFTGLGITVGFHRLFTHRSFVATRPVRALLAIGGSMAVEGSIISWVATHRRHHAFTDQYGDPHSPHLAQAAGLRGVLLGLWHAHMGWLFNSGESDPQEWSPDMLSDPTIVRINRAFPFLTVASFVLPALFGWAIAHSWHGMWSAFLWGSLARIFLLHHVTWSINSVCHFFGKEAYKANDESRNVWTMSLVSFGESWHNNHHAFPWSARMGLRVWQIDPAWYAIGLLRALGLVTSVKVPTQAQMEAKRIR